jgi:uncharacterized Fe-S center protein
MPSKVYLANLRCDYNHNLLDKVSLLFRRAGFPEMIKEKDFVAIKLHFGEEGNVAFLPPPFYRRIAAEIRKSKGKPFLTDTNTLYSGKRKNAIDHIMLAAHHGFDISTVGVPVIISDGIRGLDYIKVKVDGKHYKEVNIASGIYHSDSMIAVSHFTGHELFGFGGAIKNLGMGCGSPSGKQMMHSDVLPKVKANRCTECGMCLKWCPVDAIFWSPSHKALIDKRKCIGCGECVVVCKFKAIGVNWKTDESIAQEKTVEYALGAVQNKKEKCGYFNFLININPDCDCANFNDVPIVPNIGILASKDPVAIDQASLDMVNNAPGISGSRLEDNLLSKNKFFDVTEMKCEAILRYSKETGLGSREYKIIEVG